MQETVAQLVVQFPWLATIFMVVGILRIVIKPLMELAKNVAAATPSPKDDAVVAGIEQSKIYTTVLFVLDWLTSIKPIAKV